MNVSALPRPMYHTSLNGGVDADRLDSGPEAFAYELTRYISSPSTVRARVMDRYGSAPSIDRITSYRSQHVFIRNSVRDAIGEPLDCDALDYSPAAIRRPNPKEIHIEREVRTSALEVAALPVRKIHQIVIPVSVGKQVLAGVAADFELGADQIAGPSRLANVVDARAIVGTVLRRRGWTYTKIGQLLGGRDHSSIHHVVSMADVYARRNPNFTPILERNLERFCAVRATPSHRRKTDAHTQGAICNV